MELPPEENVWDSVFEQKQLNKSKNESTPKTLETHGPIDTGASTKTPYESKSGPRFDRNNEDHVKKVRDILNKLESIDFTTALDDTERGRKLKAVVDRIVDEFIKKAATKEVRRDDTAYGDHSTNEAYKEDRAFKQAEIFHKSQWNFENSLASTPNVSFAWSSSDSAENKIQVEVKEKEHRLDNQMIRERLRAMAVKSAQEIRHKHLMEQNDKKQSELANKQESSSSNAAGFKMDPLEPFVAKALPREKKKRSKPKHRSKFWFWGRPQHAATQKSKEESHEIEDPEDYNINVLSPASKSPALSLPEEAAIQPSDHALGSKENPPESLIDLIEDDEPKSCSIPPLPLS